MAGPLARSVRTLDPALPSLWKRKLEQLPEDLLVALAAVGVTAARADA